MSNINSSTANWRLYGGGGLILGGALWALAALLGKSSSDGVWLWLTIIAIAIVGAAFFFVGYGETGSNGAVGGEDTGRLALFVLAGLFLLRALLSLLVRQDVNVSSTVFDLVQLATVLVLFWAAFEIYRKGVAKGLAQVALFAVAAWALIVQILDWSNEYGWWTAFLLALTITFTGAVYLRNH